MGACPYQHHVDRLPHVQVEWVDQLPDATGGAIRAVDGHGTIVLLDRRLDGPDRRAALMHELVHEERGGGCSSPGMPAGWRPVAIREERAVNRKVARRLVPPADLEEFIQGMCDINLGVGIDEAAEYFDVPRWVARIALDLHEQTDE